MTSYPIPISRSHDAKVYRADDPLLTQDVRLCMVAERLTSWPTGANMFHGLPWITPVLGTGCLDLGDGPMLDVAAVQDSIQRWLALTAIELPRDFGDPTREAVEFATALYVDRCVNASGDRDAPEHLRVDEATAALTLLGALLTWVYHESRALSREPASRWWTRESASVDRDTRAGGRLQPGMDAAKRLIAELLRSRDSLAGPADAAVRRLLSGVRDHLGQSRLPLEDVRLLAEVTWLALIEGSSIYPGWSDLLLKLVLRYSDPRPPAGVRPKLTELTQLESAVKELLDDVTARSWKSRTDGVPSRRTRLYGAIADLLRVQGEIFAMLHKPDPFSDDPTVDVAALTADYDAAERLATAIKDDTDALLRELGDPRRADRPDIPHPACFVTSFDVELEMTLWGMGTSFRLVLPTLVISLAPNAAEIVWLIADVDPSRAAANGQSATLEALLAGPHEWHVAQRIIERSAGGDRPVVVRLSGTPMFALPDLDEDRRLADELKQLGFRQVQELHHALTVDEYTSQRLSENEWFFAGQASLAGRVSPRRDLPDHLAAGTRTHERIWLALGVQLDDPAIRSRMFAQLSAAAVVRRIDNHARSTSDEQRVPTTSLSSDVRGIAVNRRMDEDEATALHWLGFDLALDLDCGDLAPELEHCAQHLQHALNTMSDERVAEAEPGRLRWGRAREGSCSLWQKRGKAG